MEFEALSFSSGMKLKQFSGVDARAMMLCVPGTFLRYCTVTFAACA